MLTGDSDFPQDNFNNYYNQYDNLLNKNDQKEVDNEQNINITFLERERIDNAVEKLNDLNENEQNQVIKRLRGKMKKPKEKAKLEKLLNKLNNINKIKSLTDKIKKKPIISNEEEIKKEEIVKDDVERLPEDELNELTDAFISDLYNIPEETPKTRAEKREEDKEKGEKMKNVAKAINSLNKDDKDIVMQKIKNNANDDKKNEQFNKLSNIINNTNSLKSYINKLVNNKNKEREIKEINNNLDKNDLEDLKKTLNEYLFPEGNEIQNETKISDKHLNKIDDNKINKTVDIIKDLNPSQQIEVLEDLKSKAAEEINLEKFKKIFIKLKNVKNMNNIINQLSKKDDTKKIQLSNDNLPESKTEEDTKSLEGEEFIDMAESVMNCLYDEDKLTPKNK